MQGKGGSIVLMFFGVVLVLILLLIGFIISMLFVSQKRQRKFARDIEQIKSSYEKELFKAQLEIQEETLQYISREIHDNIGQFLSLAKLNLNILNFENRIIAKRLVSYSADLLTKALEDLRDLSRSLSSDLIENGGFQKAIEQQINQLQKTGQFRVIFDVKGEYKYVDEKSEIILFRILQEAIANIIRHACAQEIIISLSCIEDNVKMCIQDNGKGFDVTSISNQKNGFTSGINNMQKRAKLINAYLAIESYPGKGTKITVTTSL